MSYPLVCSECGNNEFKQRRTREVEVYVSFDGGGMDDGVDGETIDESGQESYFECNDCGQQFQDATELSPEPVWEHKEAIDALSEWPGIQAAIQAEFDL